ncbi:MAG TPA: DNA-processing protein DprA [Nitrospiraceae bacterium]|nr:DNA-processing protein DprA [Nitrospiraceae bacterium]
MQPIIQPVSADSPCEVVGPSSGHRMTRSELESWLCLRAIDGVGDLTVIRLVRAWHTPKAVLRASRAELIQSGCSSKLADAIRCGPDGSARRRIESELNAIERKRIEVRSVLDPTYPTRLKMIADPPPLLYITGTLTEQDELAVAVVGARRATASGRALTEELSHDLAGSGMTVVSGLARGVDAAAHRGALAAQGRTIAVLGCGIDRTYPPEHARLRGQIEEQGAILSEVPVGSPPHSHHFPRRNRIISGLSLGVIVTEAAISSGSLITARLAAEQGREVFAVPGFVKENASRGTNALLKEGAALIECAQDCIHAIMPQLEPALRMRVQPSREMNVPCDQLGKEEQRVYDVLSYDPRTVDDVIIATGLSVSTVMASLLSLELRQRIRPLPGHRYLRA